MTSTIETPLVIYNKLEFTVQADDARFSRFGKDMLKLIQEYSDILIGYQAENLDSLLDRPEIVCEDAGIDEAETIIPEIFRFAD